MTSDQWAGVVFALLVVVPAALMPKFGESEWLLQSRYSWWVLIPVLGGLLAGWILRRRAGLALFGGLAGFSGFWCAATWGAGSTATSVYETLGATGVGVVPVFVLYFLCKRRPKEDRTAEDPGMMGVAFQQILKRFWKQILFFGSAVVALTVITVGDLNALEAGSVDSVRLWAPVASFYERFGYWPAVLLVPIVSISCGAILCWSLMKREQSISAFQQRASMTSPDGGGT